jgi:hypothetical protein
MILKSLFLFLTRPSVSRINRSRLHCSASHQGERLRIYPPRSAQNFPFCDVGASHDSPLPASSFLSSYASATNPVTQRPVPNTVFTHCSSLIAYYFPPKSGDTVITMFTQNAPTCATLDSTQTPPASKIRPNRRQNTSKIAKNPIFAPIFSHLREEFIGSPLGLSAFIPLLSAVIPFGFAVMPQLCRFYTEFAG